MSSNLELLRVLEDGSYTGVEREGEHHIPYIVTANEKRVLNMRDLASLPEEELPRFAAFPFISRDFLQNRERRRCLLV